MALSPRSSRSYRSKCEIVFPSRFTWMSRREPSGNGPPEAKTAFSSVLSEEMV